MFLTFKPLFESDADKIYRKIIPDVKVWKKFRLLSEPTLRHLYAPFLLADIDILLFLHRLKAGADVELSKVLWPFAALVGRRDNAGP